MITVVDGPDKPVTIPVTGSMVPAVVLLLLHAPPVEALVSVMLAFTQTLEDPDIPAGKAYTVTVAEILQPVGNV